VIDLLEAGEHLSQRSIKRVARDHRATEDVPSWSAVKGVADRTGTTTESLMREAEQRHAANMNAAEFRADAGDQHGARTGKRVDEHHA
jgi:hypothetical protein